MTLQGQLQNQLQQLQNATNIGTPQVLGNINMVNSAQNVNINILGQPQNNGQTISFINQNGQPVRILKYIFMHLLYFYWVY